MNKEIIDQLLEKAINRPVSKMSNKEVEAYLGRKNREALSAPDNAIPEVTEEEKKVNALDQKRAIKFEKQGKSIDDRTVDYIHKCHSHVLSGETEESLKQKKKQPEKADGHILGTDPALRDEGEMVQKKEPDAYKSVRELVDELLNKSLREKHAKSMMKARVAASNVRSVKLSPEREKEITERAEKKLKALRQSSYKPDYSRYAERVYKEEGGEKSIDERTIDLIKSGYFLTKDRESRRKIADAVRAVRLHREGMHEEAHKINPDPDKLATAAWKHNAMIAASQREKSILNTWAKDSAFISKGGKVLPAGPGGEIQDLVKDDDDEGAE